MLAPGDQDHLLASAVFAGGFGVDALAAVTGAAVFTVLDSLGELIDHHVLYTVAGPVTQRRFDVLDTIREFAVAELRRRGAEDRVRSAHADWCLSIAESSAPELTGSNPALALDLLDREHDNLRAALTWLTARGDDERCLRLAVALWRFWWIRGHLAEGRAWLGRSLAASRGDPSAAQAAALHAAGELAEEQGDYAAAFQDFERSCSIREALGDETGVAECWNSIGLVARALGDLERATDLHARALDVLRRSGDQRGVAISLNSLAAVAYFRGDLDEAAARWYDAVDVVRSIDDRRSLGLLLGNVGAVQLAAGKHELAVAAHEESVAIARELGDVPGLARALGNLGEALAEVGDLEGASVAIDASLQLLREMGDRSVEAMVLHTRGKMAATRGDIVAAASDLFAGLEIFAEVGPSAGIAGALELLAVFAVRSGLAAAAVPILAFAATRRTDEGSSPVGEDSQLVADARRIAESRLGADAFSAAWATGASWTLDHLLRQAAALVSKIEAATERATEDSDDAARRYGLTAREIEIVSRLVGRSTDIEIAAELCVSPRTVATHVSSILRKLAVSSRRDVAGAIEALGLTEAIGTSQSRLRRSDH